LIEGGEKFCGGCGTARESNAAPSSLSRSPESYTPKHLAERILTSKRSAVTFARERGQRPFEARSLRLLGDVVAPRDSPEHADGYYRDALTLAEALGMRPLVAHCHAGLSKLYRRTGKRQRADEHLTTATTMYREMSMRYWLEKITKEFKTL